MNALTVIIERTENNFSAYLKEIDGIIAVGHSIDEIKKNIVNAIAILLDECKEYGDEIPQELTGEYSLTFEMDVESLFNFYSGIFTKAGLERITGINQKQLWHYASGLRKPRPEQKIKIETALHRLGEELISINL